LVTGLLPLSFRNALLLAKTSGLSPVIAAALLAFAAAAH
jgi:hypothetical protein